jgi:hypothetical protein
VTRPLIVTHNADGTLDEREMNDTEFAEYEAKAETLAEDLAAILAKIEDRANQLANPTHTDI